MVSQIYVDPSAPKPSILLRNALELLNGGKNWTTGTFKGYHKPWYFLGLVTRTAYCALGAIKEVNTANEVAAMLYLEEAVGGSIPVFNDHTAESFADVEAKFKEAIALAEADGN